MLKTFARLGVLVAVAVVSVPCWLAANVGEPAPAAKGRSADYMKRYRAADPIYKTDGTGKVVMECWAAPPEMWPKTTALALGTELAPKKLKGINPKSLPRDGGEQPYVWPDGTRLVLRMFQEKVTQVEVRLKSYTGNGC